MEIYQTFASVYDKMQYDVDYPFWVEKLDNYMKTLNPTSKQVLELACGTGTIGIGLAKKGYICDGVDISEDMLTVAQAKAFDAGVKMKFFNQNMTEFFTKRKYDMICCMCDGMNYLTENDQIIQTLERIKLHLNDHGIVIFDLSSSYKLEHIIGNQTFAETFDTEAYIWENEFDSVSRRLSFNLTLFVEEDGIYFREEEHHVQRAYEIDEIKALLPEQLELIEIVDGDTFESVNEKSHRICFILMKK